MKIGRIKYGGGDVSHALLEDGRATLLEGSVLDGVNTTATEIDLEAIDGFLPPVDPPNLIAIGLNYRDHAAESGKDLPQRPVIFLKATTALTGHKSPILLPEMAPEEVDYEAELAVIIGRKARKIPPERALEHVLGYTCANDVSARDCQQRLDVQWARAKSFDTFAPLGPWIETDLDPGDLRIRSLLNGRVMQDSRTSDMIFSVGELISFISHSMTLLPGTVILTGTPQGVGVARDPQVFLHEGDSVDIEIEGIGKLTSHVRSDPA